MTRIQLPHYRLFIPLFLSFFLTGISWAQSVGTIDRLRSEGEHYDLQGDVTKALSKYLEAYRLACRIDVVRAANLTVDISSIYYGRNDVRQGATYCQTGLKLLQKAVVPPDSVGFKLYSSLGEMYKKLNGRIPVIYTFPRLIPCCKNIRNWKTASRFMSFTTTIIRV